jgi:hypothetical protein
MCILKELKRFIANGSKTFREAASGQYDGDSQAVRDIRKEMLRDRNSADDSNNLKKDRRNVAGDIRRSFDKLSFNNV